MPAIVEIILSEDTLVGNIDGINDGTLVGKAGGNTVTRLVGIFVGMFVLTAQLRTCSSARTAIMKIDTTWVLMETILSLELNYNQTV